MSHLLLLRFLVTVLRHLAKEPVLHLLIEVQGQLLLDARILLTADGCVEAAHTLNPQYARNRDESSQI